MDAPSPLEINQLVGFFSAQRFFDMENAARALLARLPQSAFAWKALGTALLEQGKDALQALQQAALLMPNDADTQNNLGNMLQKLGRSHEAVICYQSALGLNPDFAEAMTGLGAALVSIGQLDAAIANYKQALALKPAYAMAHNNLGNAFRDRRQLQDALRCYHRTLQIDSGFAMARGNLLMALQYLPNADRTQVLVEHQRFGSQLETRLKPHWPRHTNSRDPDKRLRIGYVSGDFRSHAVTYFIEPVFAHHDKSQVEVFAYSNNVKHDTYTDRLIGYVDHWLTCAGMSDAQLAQRIMDDGIDILVDLAGHTAQNRLPVFAYKPAPIQITYLGYPGTSGLSAMDYRLTDRYTEPFESGADRYYTEKLLRLPDSMWCYRIDDAIPPISPLPAMANCYLTFGSFNNSNKINEDCIALWAALMQQLPTSRLLMATVPQGDMREQLKKQFGVHGVTADRIDFCGQLPSHEFHLKLQQVDVTLDPFPVNGATTTCESLWLGIPVLSLIGDRFLSRAGFSVLSAAGLPEFATETPQALIEKAVELASDLPKLAALRAGMREHLKTTPLFDQHRFTRNLEKAYRAVWHDYVTSKSTAF